jgi:2-hydroxy-3-keto-5-methylthiopentenyl-1-phosphate phosphatase
MTDTLELVVGAFGDPDVRRRTEAELGASLGLVDVIRLQYASVRAPLADVVAWLVESVVFRPGFGDLVALARTRRWPVTIVSSGLRELIGPLLAREGIAGVPVVANSVVDDAAGWRVQFRAEAACEVCGEPCKRNEMLALAGGREIVYVGDGYSDGCAALAADFVFARRRLASFLEERDIGFVRFEDFFDVVGRVR